VNGAGRGEGVRSWEGRAEGEGIDRVRVVGGMGKSGEGAMKSQVCRLCRFSSLLNPAP